MFFYPEALDATVGESKPKLPKARSSSDLYLTSEARIPKSSRSDCFKGLELFEPQSEPKALILTREKLVVNIADWSLLPGNVGLSHFSPIFNM